MSPLVDVDVGVRQGVAVVTMDDQRRYNAVSASMISALRKAIDDLRLTRECRAIVLTGAGRGFCAGADLGFEDDPFPDTEGRGQLGAWYKAQEHLAGLVVDLHECPKPVIVAVHGAAIGGGLALALACDVRIGATTSKYSARFIRVGLTGCDAGTSYLLPRIVGAGRAAELLLTGRDVGSEEAERIGLLNRVVPDDEVIDAALEIAELIAGHTEFGAWMTKAGLWANVDAPGLRQALELENRTQVLALFTGNVHEAGAAFVEGRPPVWHPL
jgi:enoyl-CoA hydratase